MIWIMLLFILIQLIAYPVVGIRIVEAIFKKDILKLKKNGKQLVGLLVFSGLVFNVIPGSKYFWWPIEAIDSIIYTKDLTGRSFVLGIPDYEWDSGRGFQGDGNSITVYNLGQSSIDYFMNVDSVFYQQYPKQNLRVKWQTSKWLETPLRKDDYEAFHFALAFSKNPEYDLEEILQEKDNLYAFQYLMHSYSDDRESYGDVDFYIVCPKRKIIIIMNHNT